MRTLAAFAGVAGVAGQSAPAGSTPIVAPKTKKHNTEGGISKVISLLKDMKNTIADDVERDAGLYDKFACYCKEERESVGARIEHNKAELVKLTKSVNLETSLILEAEHQIKFETANIAREKKKQKQMKDMLDKEEDNFGIRKAEHIETLNVLSKAIGALTKKSSGSQTFLELDSNTKKTLALVQQLTGKSVGQGAMGAATGYLVEMKKQTASDLQQQTKEMLNGRATYNKETLISMQAVALHLEIKTTQGRILAENMEKRGQDVKAYNAAKKEMDADVKFFDTMTTDCEKRSRFYGGQVRDAQAEKDAIDAAMPILQGIVDGTNAVPTFLQTSMSMESRVDATSRVIAKLSSKYKARMMSTLKDDQATGGVEKLVGTCESMIADLKVEIKDVETNKATCLSETHRLEQELNAAVKAKNTADNALKATEAALEHKIFEIEDCQSKIARTQKKTDDLIAQCNASKNTLDAQETELRAERGAIESAIEALERAYGVEAVGSQAESERYTENLNAGNANVSSRAKESGQPGTDFADTADRRQGGNSIVQMLVMIRDQVAKNIGDTKGENEDTAAACTKEKGELRDVMGTLKGEEIVLNGEKVALGGLKTANEGTLGLRVTQEGEANDSLEDYGNCAQKIKEYNNAISAKYADIDGLTLVIGHLSNIDQDFREKSGTV